MLHRRAALFYLYVNISITRTGCGAEIYLERQNMHCLCRDNSCKATEDMFSSAVMSGLWSSFELVELESLSEGKNLVAGCGLTNSVARLSWRSDS